jgi:hypothetical protein
MNRDAPQLSAAQLADVCYVIDALGEATKQNFKRKFCDTQMSDYDRTFADYDEVGEINLI